MKKVHQNYCMKMVAKELEGQTNVWINKDAGNEMIRYKVTSLIKKHMKNPSNGAASASMPSKTSNATEVVTSAQALKITQKSRNSEDFVIQSVLWKIGA